MKTHPVQPHIIISLVVMFGLCLLMLVSPSRAILQTNCQIPSFEGVSDPKTAAWPQGAQVQINIDPSFTSQETISTSCAHELE